MQVDIAPIATQYLAYMDAMKSLDIELTADYMVMAALLADLKSRLCFQNQRRSLLKRPKQALIDRLETYLRVKKLPNVLDSFLFWSVIPFIRMSD